MFHFVALLHAKRSNQSMSNAHCDATTACLPQTCRGLFFLLDELTPNVEAPRSDSFWSRG